MVIKSFLFALIAFSLTACKSGAPRGRSGAPVGARPDVIAPIPPAGKPVEEAPAPPARHEEKKVAVILGPGGAKSFAHVGVLKAFQAQRIPVDKIIGLEWGALIAGLYAPKGQVHDVEWKLYKMEQQKIFEPRGFWSKRNDQQPISIMDGFITEAFGNEEVSRAKVPFACPTRGIWNGSVSWNARGPFRDVVKRCMAFPPTFKLQGDAMAGPSQATEAVDLLVREGYNVIILVNALGSAMPVGREALQENLNYVILWQEIKRALLETARLNIDVVNVDTSRYSMIQFGSKKELILLGETAGNKAAGALISKYGF